MHKLQGKACRKIFIGAAIAAGVTVYAIVYIYVIIRIFYELFFTPIYFITRGYELSLILALFNAFCFWPLLVPKGSLKILKGNLVITTFAYFLIFLIGTTNVGTLLGKPLTVSDKLSRADAIIVLDTGYVDIRFMYGAELYQSGYADTLVTFMPREYGRFLVKSSGAPPDKVFYLSGGVSTYAQAVVVRELFEHRIWKKGILVTVPYHMLRARQAFRKQGLEVLCAPVPDSMWYGRPGRFIQDHRPLNREIGDYGFWDRFKIRHTWTMQILHEYTGMIYYWLRGYI